MSLADLWYVSEYDNVTILAPENNCETKYKKGIIQSIAILKSHGIEIPPHTIIIFPVNYSKSEAPVSYPAQNLIMLFPLENPIYSISEYVTYQYLHEIGHLLTGSFEQPYKWIGELLACSCNFFFFPKDNLVNSFYDVCIAKKTLLLEQNKNNFRFISPYLAGNQYFVYKGDYQIQSALYAYSLENNAFDFVSTLKEFAAKRDKTKEQTELILKIVNLLK